MRKYEPPDVGIGATLGVVMPEIYDPDLLPFNPLGPSMAPAEDRARIFADRQRNDIECV